MGEDGKGWRGKGRTDVRGCRKRGGGEKLITCSLMFPIPSA